MSSPLPEILMRSTKNSINNNITVCMECGDATFSFKGCHISMDAIYCHVFWVITGLLFVETWWKMDLSFLKLCTLIRVYTSTMYTVTSVFCIWCLNQYFKPKVQQWDYWFCQHYVFVRSCVHSFVWHTDFRTHSWTKPHRSW